MASAQCHPWMVYGVRAGGCDTSITLRKKHTFIEVYDDMLHEVRAPTLRRSSSQPSRTFSASDSPTDAILAQELHGNRYSLKQAPEIRDSNTTALSDLSIEHMEGSSVGLDLNDSLIAHDSPCKKIAQVCFVNRCSFKQACDSQDLDTTVPSDSGTDRMQGSPVDSDADDFVIPRGSTCKKAIRPCKGKRERYRKVVARLTEKYRSDPQSFDISNIQLPPAIGGCAWLVQKLDKRVRSELKKIEAAPRSAAGLFYVS